MSVQGGVDEWAGVELYQAELAKYLSVGGVVALLALCFGVFGVSSGLEGVEAGDVVSAQRRKGVRVAVQFLAFIVATLALWAGLFMGVHMGFGEWQGSPGAGDKAYADGAQLTGSLMFGWMPAVLVAALAWLLLTASKWFFGRKP
jgi:hypothetical protein